MNRMQQTTVCLVFLDSCGCGPTPRIHRRAEHPGWRSMALERPRVKCDSVVTASVKYTTVVRAVARTEEDRGDTLSVMAYVAQTSNPWSARRFFSAPRPTAGWLGGDAARKSQLRRLESVGIVPFSA